MINSPYATKLTREIIAGVTNPSVDMTNHKPRKSGKPRDPAWSVPNKKAAARLDSRRKNMPVSKNAGPGAFKRPGSMNMKRG